MTKSPFSLDSKTILITGASSGIGRACAVEISRMGVSECLLVGRNTESLQATADMMDSDCKVKLLVGDLTGVETMREISESISCIDGVVFNAGINIMKPVQFYTEKYINEIFNINCFSPMLLVKNLLRNKKIKPGASLVFTSSISGFSNFSVGNGIYSASKSALTAYMRSLALEVSGKGIRCNAVHPGRIETPLIHKGYLSDDEHAADAATYPLKRYGRPEEVAYAIIYLLSDAAAWITGTSMVIDGGKSLV